MIGGCWRSKACWLPLFFLLTTLLTLVFIVDSWEPQTILPLESKSSSLCTLNFSLLQSFFQSLCFFLILFVITLMQPFFRLTRCRHYALILFGQLNLFKLLIHWRLGLESIGVRGEGGLSAEKLLIWLLTVLLFWVISHINFWNIHWKWRIKYLYIFGDYI